MLSGKDLLKETTRSKTSQKINSKCKMQTVLLCRVGAELGWTAVVDVEVAKLRRA